MSSSPIGLLVVHQGDKQTKLNKGKIYDPACFRVSWLLYHAWITYRMSSRAILSKPDYVTRDTMRHLRLSWARRMETWD